MLKIILFVVFIILLLNSFQCNDESGNNEPNKQRKNRKKNNKGHVKNGTKGKKNGKNLHLRNEIDSLKHIQPHLLPNDYVMYWRPQKVGSSTIISLLISFGFRFNKYPRPKAYTNSFCVKIASCAVQDPRLNSNATTVASLQQFISTNRKSKSSPLRIREAMIEELPYHLSVNHELCNMKPEIIEDNLKCAFYSRSGSENLFHSDQLENIKKVKEIFVLRDPLSRMISVYYFWGELFRMQHMSKLPNEGGQHITRLGMSDANVIQNPVIKGSMFTYHGNESSVPPLDIAMEFADRFPLTRGMPGPSFTWSAFANTVESAEKILRTGRIMTIVTERLDESLVVLKYYMGWTLADVVTTAHRKALSAHPKHSSWPQRAVGRIKDKLHLSGEYKVYDAANEALDGRIRVLEKRGISVADEVVLLKRIRERVSQQCHTEKFLLKYKAFLESLGFQAHASDNRLRDGDNKYTDEGHMFSFLGEILFSYDICGNCEAHALQLGLEMKWSDNIESLPMLEDIPRENIADNIYFRNCPIF